MSSAASTQQAVEGSALSEMTSVAATSVTASEVQVSRAGRESVATLKRILQEHPLAGSPLQADRVGSAKVSNIFCAVCHVMCCP